MRAAWLQYHDIIMSVVSNARTGQLSSYLWSYLVIFLKYNENISFNVFAGMISTALRKLTRLKTLCIRPCGEQKSRSDGCSWRAEGR